jgi:hypothetical protein
MAGLLQDWRTLCYVLPSERHPVTRDYATTLITHKGRKSAMELSHYSCSIANIRHSSIAVAHTRAVCVPAYRPVSAPLPSAESCGASLVVHWLPLNQLQRHLQARSTTCVFKRPTDASCKQTTTQCRTAKMGTSRGSKSNQHKFVRMLSAAGGNTTMLIGIR